MAFRLSIFNLLLSLFLFLTISHFSLAQTDPVAPSPGADDCNGIFLSYTYIDGLQIPPNRSDTPKTQPYSFKSQLIVLNNGDEELKSWMVFVGFQHDEYLISASNAVLVDGTLYPARVGNGTVFAGFPATDLQTAIETAGDLTQMSAQIDLVGTQFGVKAPAVPMPKNISLANDGFLCPKPVMEGKRQMQVCCNKDPKFKPNATALNEKFLPRQNGDLTIMYDVLRTYDTNYWALVTMSNHNPLGRLDNWKLSWDWMKQEFIFAMKGAYPDIVDSSECVFGPQGQEYKGLDFSTVLNCERRPTIIDLPLTKTNDTNIGMIPFCCRNGTILPQSMDPSRSTSAFQINVFKMPPDVNRSQLSPPQNWKISGRLNPDYKCGPPVRVSPSQFPDPGGLPDTTAVASWQVVCNITQAKGSHPRCCVSFSAFYNESVIPCKTCACGCPSDTGRTCSTKAPALFLPSQALLVPFENRTNMAVAWAALKHFSVPNPMPCGDNCGVSINWHLATDYRSGWTARMTIFNWEDSPFIDWFMAIEMDKAAPGFEAVYSFNGSALEVDGLNNTILMQGLQGLNYLVAESDGADPKKKPRVPGKQQSVISFKKKETPGINVVMGDGFPTKVFFNGEECSLPTILPASSADRKGSTTVLSMLLALLVFMLMRQ